VGKLKRVDDHIGRLRRFAEDHGIAVSVELTNKSHNRVTLTKDGRETFIIIPGSTSDKARGPKKAFSDGKRKMREQGWIE
jgi:hypothetical protein